MIQNLVNIMAAGALVTQGAKTSAATVSTESTAFAVMTVSEKHVVFQREEFQLPVPSQF